MSRCHIISLFQGDPLSSRWTARIFQLYTPLWTRILVPSFWTREHKLDRCNNDLASNMFSNTLFMVKEFLESSLYPRSRIDLTPDINIDLILVILTHFQWVVVSDFPFGVSQCWVIVISYSLKVLPSQFLDLRFVTNIKELQRAPIAFFFHFELLNCFPWKFQLGNSQIGPSLRRGDYRPVPSRRLAEYST